MKKSEIENFKPDEYDYLGFTLFNKALHKILQVNEGIVIENEINGLNKKFIVGKWIKNNEVVVGIEFNIDDENLKDGMYVELINQEDLN